MFCSLVCLALIFFISRLSIFVVYFLSFGYSLSIFLPCLRSSLHLPLGVAGDFLIFSCLRSSPQQPWPGRVILLSLVCLHIFFYDPHLTSLAHVPHRRSSLHLPLAVAGDFLIFSCVRSSPHQPWLGQVILLPVVCLHLTSLRPSPFTATFWPGGCLSIFSVFSPLCFVYFIQPLSIFFSDVLRFTPALFFFLLSLVCLS